MSALIFFIIIILTFAVFTVPKSIKYYCSLGILVSGIVLTSVWSIIVLAGGGHDLKIEASLPVINKSISLIIDRLSAFFIIVINITVLVGLLYARGYLKPYLKTKNSLRFSIHYFSYLWLYFSMILVVMIRDGLSFLIVWEIMALSSFLLVIFDAEDTTIMKTGISYLIQMHAGMFFLMIAFLIVGRETGEMSFDALQRLFLRSFKSVALYFVFYRIWN